MCINSSDIKHKKLAYFNKRQQPHEHLFESVWMSALTAGAEGDEYSRQENTQRGRNKQSDEPWELHPND